MQVIRKGLNGIKCDGIAFGKKREIFGFFHMVLRKGRGYICGGIERKEGRRGRESRE
jgi:hypothetical protein